MFKEITMKALNVVVLLLIAMLFVGCGGPKGTVAQQRTEILKMRDTTLADLYKLEPISKDKVRKAAGYGVFSNVNVNVIFVGVGGGYGVVVDNSNGNEVFMKMGMGGVGFGAGVKDLRAVIIFKDAETLAKFVDKGWEFGAQADAAAKAGEKGGAVGGAEDVTSGMEIYQFTENGVSLQATVTGTKYWKNNDLN